MWDFFSKLFDESSFMRRSECGDWTGNLKWAYIISNASIAIAFLVIPIALLFLYVKRRKDIPRPTVLLFFISFIWLASLTFFLNVIVFWWAPYRFFTLVLIITALVSLSTATILPKIIIYFAKTPTIVEYQKLLKEKEDMALLAASEHDKVIQLAGGRGRQIEKLTTECNNLKDQIEHLRHQKVTDHDVEEMRKKLHAIRGAAQ